MWGEGRWRRKRSCCETDGRKWEGMGISRKKERRVTDGREGVKEEKGMVYLERDGREVWVEEKD